MRSFPKTVDELKAAGYRYSQTRNCRACFVAIEFWWTPENKLTPLDVGKNGDVVSHFSTCSAPEQFRRAPAQKGLFS